MLTLRLWLVRKSRISQFQVSTYPNRFFCFYLISFKSQFNDLADLSKSTNFRFSRISALTIGSVVHFFVWSANDLKLELEWLGQ